MGLEPLLKLWDSYENGWVCLKVAGEVDLSSAPQLEHRLQELRAEKRQVRLDLSEVRFMDSTGLNLLIAATNDSRRDGWHFEVGQQVSPQVRRLFEAAGVEHFILTEQRPD